MRVKMRQSNPGSGFTDAKPVFDATPTAACRIDRRVMEPLNSKRTHYTYSSSAMNPLSMWSC